MFLLQQNMVKDINLNIVVSNILSEKRYSHCRLCLKIIKEHYVRLNDAVSLYPSSGIFQPLSEILTNLLDESVSRTPVTLSDKEKYVYYNNFLMYFSGL